MKKHLYPLLLLAVLLLGCVGHLLLRPKEVPETPYFAAFRIENANNLLLYSLPEAGDRLAFFDVSGTILEIAHTPHTVRGRSEGELLSRPSTLFSELTVTLLVQGHEKEGRFYLGERLLTLGEEVILSGENFSVCAHFVSFKTGF